MTRCEHDSSPPFAGCWFLTGPTASGKTAVGLELAQRLEAEIISVDSMALYRGLDIGTAKPTAAEQARVRHHLLDVCDPHEESSVAQYLELATRAVEEIRQRGQRVLFVGGSPLYLKALLLGLFDGPPADWELRQELQDWAATTGPDALHARVAVVDPQAAARLHPRDTRRLVRALEVYELTGRPISHWQTQFDDSPGPLAGQAFALSWPRAQLYARIEQRVDAMFAAGLVAETERVLSAGRPLSRTARQAVGYREVLAHLEQGTSLDETIALVKTKTRQFAKRQLTWFRSLKMLRNMPLTADQSPAEIARAIHQAGAATEAAS
ncbi:MAG: tRNA (adenosine(37)-N6)-dimethylallyltransferase MiaA [Planctomycetaceae bacterium]|nr:tRNA (adenosine(37)-N6)-dimethylallyltransferase MiaA [Planctomycetaceae bacterium]